MTNLRQKDVAQLFAIRLEQVIRFAVGRRNNGAERIAIKAAIANETARISEIYGNYPPWPDDEGLRTIIMRRIECN